MGFVVREKKTSRGGLLEASQSHKDGAHLNQPVSVVYTTCNRKHTITAWVPGACGVITSGDKP